jgi:hypothetical protein
MNVGALPELILSWLMKQGTNLLSNEQGQSPQGQFQPGQQYDAQVLANLANGRSLVQVGDQKLDMLLPQSAKPGDVLNLTYLQAGTRPTFVMVQNNAPATSTVNFSQAVQKVDALTRYVPVSGPAAPNSPVSATAGANPMPANASAQLASPSQTSPPILPNPAVLLVPEPAKGVTTFMQAVDPAPAMTGEAVEGAQAANAANTSVLTTRVGSNDAAAGNHVLPVRLQQTVKESGLFYESHLGKWVRGEVSLDSIQREPQAKLAQNPGPLLDLPDLEGMPAHAAHLASRQLNMLDGQPFIWQGQVWPGQDMEWQVGEGGGDGQDAEAQKWHSRLRLTLPRMGGVSAELDIGALGLRIRLGAQSDETLAEMKTAMPELAHRLKTAGLNLTSVVLESNHDIA